MCIFLHKHIPVSVLMAVANKIEDFKIALSGATTIMSLQRDIMGDDQFNSVVAGMADSLLAKVAAISSVTPAEVIDLSDLVRVSILTPALQGKIVTALASQCLPDAAATFEATKTQTQIMTLPDK